MQVSNPRKYAASVRSATNVCAASSLPALDSAIKRLGTVRQFRRSSGIYAVNEPAEYLYKILSGTVRTCKLLQDGRRQVVSFYASGDIFGLEFAAAYTLSAEAIDECKLLAASRNTLISTAARNGRLAGQLWLVPAGELERARTHAMSLTKSAEERVTGFLLQMARLAKTDVKFDLPMSRQDIADYLGLSIETVSRTMTQLAREAAIEIHGSRGIVLRGLPGRHHS